MNSNALLDVRDLNTHFFTVDGAMKAVNGVSFSIAEGETLGIVGESGCGKSVTSQSILRIVPKNGKIMGGQILFRRDDENFTDLATLDPRGQEIRSIRGKDVAMVFQEPMTAFSPVYTVGNQIIEAIRLHTDLNAEKARSKAIEILRSVEMPKAEKLIDSYTFNLSGGMRQRAMIAMALACSPKLLIADEPTSALDVTIQAQILDLLKNLQQKNGMAIMMITHDLGVVAQVADNVLIMYLGDGMEYATVETLFRNPKHPYTVGLLRNQAKITSLNKSTMI
jgi:peptide/nickel transport system ATP-binding protein